jgi:GT2 family glycosyltransferase
MPKTKGVAAPFFFALQSPWRRSQALLAQAVQDFGSEHFSDALVGAEAVCRALPSESSPAVLRAKILEKCRPTLAPSAWVAAWARDPLDPALQDAMLDGWMRSGNARRAIEQGFTFLARRCQAGTEGSLVELLARAGAEVAGACWRDGNTLALRCFRGGVAGAGERVVISTPEADTVHLTGDDGALAISCPPGTRIDRVTLEAGPALQGTPLVFPETRKPRARQRVQPGIDIIVPVYRDVRGVQACITSVLDSLPRNRTHATVKIVNDASPEPLLVLWLEGLAAAGRITLIHNRFNLGFIEAVNRPLAAGRRHALLLNADTVVHGDWLDRMLAALDSAPDIASVMPWSNNGEIGNLATEGATAAPGPAELQAIDSAASRLHASGLTQDIEVPTTSGFAMLLRREAIDAIGTLDSAELTRGYLEEVDWCLRAREAGWRHLLATGVFVAHKGSTSFRFEKQLRVRQNRGVVTARYPRYYAEYTRFLRDDPMAPQRAALLSEVARAGVPWPAKEAAEPLRIDASAALQGDAERVAVWGVRAGTPEAAQVLSVARSLASGPLRNRVRLLVFGGVAEPLLHTGVVDALPAATKSEVLPDAMLASFAGCREVIAPACATVPDGVHFTPLGTGFNAGAWVASRAA